MFKQLTKNQIYRLTEGSKHWSDKKEHLTKLALSFGIQLKSEDDLKYLLEVHCPNEEKRIKLDYFRNSQTGILKTKFTPTDTKGDFSKVLDPIIGRKYHISWAFSGAVFVLVKIEGDYAYMDNPRYKRKELLKCKVQDLRNLR
jgi:hypothetical protein